MLEVKGHFVRTGVTILRVQMALYGWWIVQMSGGWKTAKRSFNLSCLKKSAILTNMDDLAHYFLTYYIYLRVKAYRELNLVRALDEDTGVFSSYSPRLG